MATMTNVPALQVVIIKKMKHHEEGSGKGNNSWMFDGSSSAFFVQINVSAAKLFKTT